VALVRPHQIPRAQVPQAGVVVGAGRDEVGRIGGEDGVPDPALVVLEHLQAAAAAAAVSIERGVGLDGRCV
jgi:hypothetical protein